MNLYQQLVAEGLKVNAVSGWQTRSRPGGLSAVGVMLHHTATSRTQDALPSIINGRSDLAGPLSNVLIRRSGVVELVAAGRCNHAGNGSSRVYRDMLREIAPSGDARARGLYDDMNGNGFFFGIEVENNGVSELYPPEQIVATVKTCAALSRPRGWSASRSIHHREWTRRKIDMSYRLDIRSAIGHQIREDKSMGITHKAYAPIVAVLKPLKQKGVVIVTADGRVFTLNHRDEQRQLSFYGSPLHEAKRLDIIDAELLYDSDLYVNGIVFVAASGELFAYGPGSGDVDQAKFGTDGEIVRYAG